MSALKIPAGEVTLAADAFGDPADPPVVLLHGGGQTRHSWGATASDLGSSGWYAITVDLRGHGQSDWSPDHVYGMDRFSADVVRIVEHLGRPPVLIGASLGGNASLAALGHYPELALGLVLVDVSPFLQPAGASRIRDFMTANADEGFASLDEVADAIAAYLPHRPRPSDLSGLRKNLRLGEDGRWRWHWDPAFVTGMSRRRAADAQAEPRYDEMDLPVHLIRGRMSELVSREAAEAFVAILRHGSFTDVADAGHMVAGDRNDAFLEAALTFLETQPG